MSWLKVVENSLKVCCSIRTMNMCSSSQKEISSKHNANYVDVISSVDDYLNHHVWDTGTPASIADGCGPRKGLCWNLNSKQFHQCIRSYNFTASPLFSQFGMRTERETKSLTWCYVDLRTDDDGTGYTILTRERQQMRLGQETTLGMYEAWSNKHMQNQTSQIAALSVHKHCFETISPKQAWF